MDEELKRKWVKALRSGKYEQGKGNLRDLNNKYCCLGVLCDVQGRRWYRHNHYVVRSGGEYDGGGLDDQKIDDVLGPDNAFDLAHLNDCGADFAQIADYIERNL